MFSNNPEVVIRKSSVPDLHSWNLFVLIQNVWRHRELVMHLTRRTIKVQYKQSVLGYLWIFLNPISQAAIYTLVFSTILDISSEGVPFTVFVFTGLLPWIFFAATVGAGTESVVAAGDLIRSVYFPRELLVVSVVISRCLDFAASMAILVVLLVYYGIVPSLQSVWLPIIFVSQFAFALGLSLPLAAANLYLRDVRYLIGVLLNLWFFVTPIFYPHDLVPSEYRFLYDLNPIARFINAYRNALIYDRALTADLILISVLLSFITLWFGYAMFKRLERNFAESL